MFHIKTWQQELWYFLIDRSPSQTPDEFIFFIVCLNLILGKLRVSIVFLTILTSDFNAKSRNWCKEDRTIHESQIIYNLTSQLKFIQT